MASKFKSHTHKASSTQRRVNPINHFNVIIRKQVSGAQQDLSYWNCKLKLSTSCPNSDVTFFLYTSGRTKRRFHIDLKNKQPLHYSGWNPNKLNVIIIHGFNGAENQNHMTIIRNAYLKRGDFNVFTVDWMPLTRYPCYLSSLSNMRLVSLCAAQFYSHLTYSGASAFNIHCVGHSLGAHLCGMISNHLTLRQHKIIGLDPARPLVSMFSSDEFRLTRDDANVVEIIHTNIGMYGDTPRTGDVDFCVNGGRLQPVCSRESNIIRQGRCSHLTSTCYFAESLVKNRVHFLGIPCTDSCDTLLLPKNSKQIVFVPMGLHTPERTKGTFCVQYKISRKTCPFE
ncbi:phospholipase A1 VesT1.02-like [Adelges cooleyi]|uniref:phospholipase A1 VesT1.02-like n=1 Tax=Adelges cooleyi TaxID=133065 RepID=UPI0021809ABD|nr:phospholipase A1 VesT1.02-like [Adelges cooleyi]